MTDLLDQAIAKVKKLPADEQDNAAYALIDYLESRESMTLTDEQLTEVKRRRGDPNPVLVSHADAREFIRQLIAK